MLSKELDKLEKFNKLKKLTDAKDMSLWGSLEK